MRIRPCLSLPWSLYSLVVERAVSSVPYAVGTRDSAQLAPEFLPSALGLDTPLRLGMIPTQRGLKWTSVDPEILDSEWGSGVQLLTQGSLIRMGTDTSAESPLEDTNVIEIRLTPRIPFSSFQDFHSCVAPLISSVSIFPGVYSH